MCVWNPSSQGRWYCCVKKKENVRQLSFLCVCSFCCIRSRVQLCTRHPATRETNDLTTHRRPACPQSNVLFCWRLTWTPLPAKLQYIAINAAKEFQELYLLLVVVNPGFVPEMWFIYLWTTAPWIDLHLLCQNLQQYYKIKAIIGLLGSRSLWMTNNNVHMKWPIL